MSPLHVAAERGGRLNIVKYLVEKKANIDIQDNNEVNLCNWTYSLQAPETEHYSHSLIFQNHIDYYGK